MCIRDSINAEYGGERAWHRTSSFRSRADMGRDEAKSQSKDAQKAKDEANRLKKEKQREKVWAVGAKDSSKDDAAAEKAKAASDRKAAAKAQLEAEGGVCEEPPKNATASAKKTKCPGCGKRSVITKKNPCQGCALGK
eukprot:TRINITY_DN16590_c0_g1_i1.p1 TRINITY_DN16590_c0_g1~~TRINITY_DN16590_c0_g1_i1.p1  ORF type:complete len:138 (-),score=52.74 TRINITY_DN16590_c0_g1_i1:232-645(-)